VCGERAPSDARGGGGTDEHSGAIEKPHMKNTETQSLNVAAYVLGAILLGLTILGTLQGIFAE